MKLKGSITLNDADRFAAGYAMTTVDYDRDVYRFINRKGA